MQLIFAGQAPSINNTNLNLIKDEITFGVNSIFLKSKTFTPTFYVVEDHLVAEDRSEEIINYKGPRIKFFPIYLAYCFPEGSDTIFFNHRPRISYPNGFDFSTDASKVTYTGCTVTFTCMQLAFHMGFKEIYLVGVDFDYKIPHDVIKENSYGVDVLTSLSSDPNHFDSKYFGKGYRWHNPQVEKMGEAYQEAKGVTEAQGVKIYNATKGGKLEIFQRVEYESLFDTTANGKFNIFPKADYKDILGNTKKISKKNHGIKISNYNKEFLVSAIVSTYNSERFIRGCLEDLEAQTIADRLEIIVVNSGSQQNEEAIVKEFQKKYSNIKYIKTDQRETVYAAWNRGIKTSSGKYITNANTDDRHRADAYERMVEALEGRPDIALVYANVVITENENETFRKCTPAGSYRWLDWNRRYLLEKGCFIGPQPMWRRSLHDEYGYFDDTLVTSGDYEFWLRLSQTNNFHHIPDFLGLYLRSPNSIETSNLEIQKTENEKILRMYREADASGDMIRRFYSDNDEELIRIHNQRGEELFNAEKFKSARIIFEQILSKNPNLIEPLNNLGVIAFQQGELDQAAFCFARALETDENYFEAIENLGKCGEAQKDYLKAAEWFERALKLKPDEISLLNSLGNCFIQAEDLVSAAKIYEKSLRLDSSQESIEIILREMKRLEDAKKVGCVGSEHSACG